MSEMCVCVAGGKREGGRDRGERKRCHRKTHCCSLHYQQHQQTSMCICIYIHICIYMYIVYYIYIFIYGTSKLYFDACPPLWFTQILAHTIYKHICVRESNRLIYVWYQFIYIAKHKNILLLLLLQLQLLPLKIAWRLTPHREKKRERKNGDGKNNGKEHKYTHTRSAHEWVELKYNTQ